MDGTPQKGRMRGYLYLFQSFVFAQVGLWLLPLCSARVVYQAIKAAQRLPLRRIASRHDGFSCSKHLWLVMIGGARQTCSIKIAVA